MIMVLWQLAKTGLHEKLSDRKAQSRVPLKVSPEIQQKKCSFKFSLLLSVSTLSSSGWRTEPELILEILR